jgi:hypothetical protein
MNKCKKISVSLQLKDKQLSLNIDDDPFSIRSVIDAEADKILPKFPYYCIDENEELSDFLKTKIIDEMADSGPIRWRWCLDASEVDKTLKLNIIRQISSAPDSVKEYIIISTEDTAMKNCGEDCAPKDEEKEPDLPPLEPEDPEENILEDSETSCYSGVADITYTLNGETKTERYRFYYSGEPDESPEAPTLETINDYFTNYIGDNIPPDWLDLEGVAITKVAPDLFGPVFWLPVKSGCDNEPSPQPEPDDPVPAPEPSPPPSSPSAPQPKPDKIINVDLDGCDTKIVANIGLYNILLTKIILEIAKVIVDQVLNDREVFTKFSPSSARTTKKNKDSLIWIGSKENSLMKISSSVGVIVQDNGWGIFLESPESSVNLPVGFRFSASFNLTLKFSAILNVKCGEDTKAIPIFFGHSFDSSLILPNSNTNTKVVKFNKLPQTNTKFQLANSNSKLAPILAEILTRADLEISSDIINSNNGLKYKDFVETKIANSLKAVVVETINESKRLSGCDCCLQSITDIKIVNELFQIKDITSLGGDSIFRPELRFGDKK